MKTKEIIRVEYGRNIFVSEKGTLSEFSHSENGVLIRRECDTIYKNFNQSGIHFDWNSSCGGPAKLYGKNYIEILVIGDNILTKFYIEKEICEADYINFTKIRCIDDIKKIYPSSMISEFKIHKQPSVWEVKMNWK